MSIEQLNDKNIISFDVNKINILNSKEIETNLMKLRTKSKLTINLSNVKFIDSTGFNMLRRLKSILNFEFININNETQELFNLVDFNI